MGGAKVLAVDDFSAGVLAFLVIPLCADILAARRCKACSLTISAISLLVPVLSIGVISNIVHCDVSSECSQTSVFSVKLQHVSITAFVFTTVLTFGDVFRVADIFTKGRLLVLLCFVSALLCSLLARFTGKYRTIGRVTVTKVVDAVYLMKAGVLLLLIFGLKIAKFFVTSYTSRLVPTVCLTTQLGV